MNDHACRCGKYGTFGFRNVNSEQFGGYDWFCGEHRHEGVVNMEQANPQPSLDFGLNIDREAAFQRCLGGWDWETKFMAYIRYKVPFGEEGLSEVWRLRAEKIFGPPPDDHIVGAVVRRAVTEGLLIGTGRYLAPRDRKSNASKKQVWRRTTAI